MVFHRFDVAYWLFFCLTFFFQVINVQRELNVQIRTVSQIKIRLEKTTVHFETAININYGFEPRYQQDRFAKKLLSRHRR